MNRKVSGRLKLLRALVSAWVFIALVLTGLSQPANAQRQREYVQTIWLNGFYCIAVQRDSIVGPANEVFFVLVTNAPSSQGMRGSSVGTFGGVVPGYSRKLRNRIWSGPQQPLSLRVMMFERDAGKETGATLARAMVAYGTSLMSSGRGAKTPYRNGSAAGGGKPKRASLSEDDQIDPIWTRAYATVFDRALGLSHDPMGYDRQTFQPGDWSRKPTYTERGIRYHFYTTHRQNGANCRAYFLIERGNEVRQPKPPPRPPQSVAEPRPDSGYGNPYDDPNAVDPSGPFDQSPPYDPAPPPVYESPPPPPEPEPDWFRVRFKNLCDVPIELSYAYKNPSRGWVKRGWGLFGPGKSGRMEGNTLKPEIYIYTSRGRISGSFDPQVIQLAVRRDGFDVDRTTSFKGEDGARMVPFAMHVLSDISGTETVAIRDCEQWVAGKLLSTKEIARIRQMKDFRERQAQIALDSALNEAAFAGDAKGIKAALERGANIENRSARLSLAGSTPIHLAMKSFNGEAINRLLDNGADPTKLNSTGGTVFHSAVSAYKTSLFFDEFPTKAFTRVAKAGVDFDKSDNRRRTALGKLTRFLSPDNVKQKVAAMKRKPKKDQDFFSFLASHTRVDLNNRYEGRGTLRHYTALHVAAFSGHRPLAEALLANGADPHSRDGAGKVPRERAAAWPEEFQQLFGPMPVIEDIPAKPPAQAPAQKPALDPQVVDPAAQAARCRQLVANGVMKPDDCEAPN